MTVRWWPDRPDAPSRFPSPFDELGPHPLARRAAVELQDDLRRGLIAPGVPADLLSGPMGGKMFGVLVVRGDDGRLGVLRAFSATLAGTWDVVGYAPPLFDRRERSTIEPAGDSAVKRIHAAATALTEHPLRLDLLEELHALDVRHAAESDAMAAEHRHNRSVRRHRRVGLDDADLLHALDQASRRDKAERRRLDERHAGERMEVEERLRPLERRLRACERLRRWTSRRAMRAIFDTYRLESFDGRTASLRDLWCDEPPAGAGDCAGAKLLGEAVRLGLRPVAMAEFWWGTPPPSGGRVQGAFHPACREKCGPLLPFLCQGLDVDPPRRFAPPVAVPASYEVVHEDARLVVIHKPAGLLSVEGRVDAPDLQSLLRERYSWVRLAHRLDLDTSGLLVAARDEATSVALQRMFLERTMEKRYVAVLDGVVTGDEGSIELPMRGDPADRPRQVVDPVHGKAALTRWRVLERRGTTTLVALWPHTGRTHQLRVHAAHPDGLDAPIVGDRLYGREGPRLMLHAEALAFRHPVTGERLLFERQAFRRPA